MLGLAAFCVAAVAGLAMGNSAPDVILRAIAAMFVGYVIGLAIGHAGVLAVREHVAKFEADNPVPEAPEIPAEEDTEIVAEAA